AGVLGIPQSDAYTVPNGLRSDFEHGSLILNQATGIVTTVWKTFNDTYQQEASRPAPGQGAAPAGAPAPAPAAAPAPAPAPAPAEAPAPEGLQFPSPADFLPPEPAPAG
uniref:LGFP repeat-containing protein n=1 Tax=Nocardia brasiliensis TaxID=37326 RepID=UPI003CC7F96F